MIIVSNLKPYFLTTICTTATFSQYSGLYVSWGNTNFCELSDSSTTKNKDLDNVSRGYIIYTRYPEAFDQDTPQRKQFLSFFGVDHWTRATKASGAITIEKTQFNYLGEQNVLNRGMTLEAF